MVISKNSQLGLMMDDKDVAVQFLELMLKKNQDLKDSLDVVMKVVEQKSNEQITELYDTKEKVEKGEVYFTDEDVKKYVDQFPDIEIDLPQLESDREIKNKVSDCLKDTILNFINNQDSKLYLICDGVEKCSKMIRMGDNFSSRALRNISFGKHTYLLGKNEVCRFICAKGAIKGIYWDKENEICFEYGFDLDSDGYYFEKQYADQFNKITKIITFVELGDIDVVMLETGRNNGKKKNNGKVTNTSPFTVYVVDSSWNQLIIRTEGFAVMGHFRLQPFGPGMIDRKLIWINAFEKHGYKRQPKAKILHENPLPPS